MNAQIKEGKLVLTIDLEEGGKGYQTEKGNVVIATTRGNKPFSLKVMGKDEVVNIRLNAYIKK